MIVYNQSQISAEQVTKILVRQTRKNQISKFVLSILVLISGISVLAYGYYNSESTYIGVGYAFFTFGIVYLAFSIYSVAGALKKVKKRNQVLFFSRHITQRRRSFQRKISKNF